MAYTEFPLQFKRQYAAPLDIDGVFTTNAEMQAYLTDPVRYAGQPVTCLEFPTKVFILNAARTAWGEVGGGDTASLMVESEFVGPEATKSVNNADSLGGVAAGNHVLINQYGVVPDDKLPDSVKNIIDIHITGEILADFGDPTLNQGKLAYNLNSEDLFKSDGADWLPETRIVGAFYVILPQNNKQYRWSGVTMEDLSPDLSSKENTGVAAGLITNLKDGVATAGDTLQKLYNLIQGAVEQYTEPDIAGRDLLNIDKLNCSVFVTDDGDGKWAIYKPTTLGVGATFTKTMDQDSLAAVMSAAQIKTAYESNPDTNAFTNALLAKLNAFTANFTSEMKTAYDAAVIHAGSAHAPVEAQVNDDAEGIKTKLETLADAEKYAKLALSTANITVATGGTLNPDWANEIVQAEILAANTDTALAVAASMSNCPTISCYRKLNILNSKSSSFTITLSSLFGGNPYFDQNGIRYTIKYMNSKTTTIIAGNLMEISYEFIFTDAINCTISIISAIQL